jgi:hypothetical protein
MPDWFWLPLSVLVFGAIALIAVVSTKATGWGEHSVRMVGLLLVVVMAVFLVVAAGANSGITKDAITPAFALLGAAAGYLFGKT